MQRFFGLYAFNKLALAIGVGALMLAVPVQAAPVSTPSSQSTWSHEELMRFYAWVIINESGQECNRVLDVVEHNTGRVVAKCSAYEKPQYTTHYYAIDSIALKPGFLERWQRMLPGRIR